MSKRFQLHPSSINRLSMCGEAFRRSVIEHDGRPGGVYRHVGTAVHHSVGADLTSKRDTEELLPDAQIPDLARDALVHEWDAHGVMLAAEEVLAGAARTKADAVDKSVRLARLHHRQVAPAVRPTHIEREFVLDLAGYDYQIAGRIDVQEGSEAIRDTKTSKRAPQEGAAWESVQLSAYALAAWKHDGALPRRAVLDYLVDTRDPKVAQPERQFPPATEEAQVLASFSPLLDRIAVAMLAIEAGIFVPARPEDWWCSERWCEFYGDCRYALRPVTVALVNIAPMEI
jgi:RecB family exonuclease